MLVTLAAVAHNLSTRLSMTQSSESITACKRLHQIRPILVPIRHQIWAVPWIPLSLWPPCLQSARAGSTGSTLNFNLSDPRHLHSSRAWGCVNQREPCENESNVKMCQDMWKDPASCGLFQNSLSHQLSETVANFKLANTWQHTMGKFSDRKFSLSPRSKPSFPASVLFLKKLIQELRLMDQLQNSGSNCITSNFPFLGNIQNIVQHLRPTHSNVQLTRAGFSGLII